MSIYRSNSNDYNVGEIDRLYIYIVRELTNEAANDRTKNGRRPVEDMNLT